MHRAIADPHRAVTVQPSERVFHPFAVVAFGVILTGMRTATFGTVFGRVQCDDRLLEQILELERLDEVGVPDHRPVRNSNFTEAVGDDVNSADAFSEHLRSAEDSAIVLHHPLHVEADVGGFARTLRLTHCV